MEKSNFVILGGYKGFHLKMYLILGTTKAHYMWFLDIEKDISEPFGEEHDMRLLMRHSCTPVSFLCAKDHETTKGHWQLLSTWLNPTIIFQ